MTTVAVTGAGGYLGGRLIVHLRGAADVAAIPLVRRTRQWLGDDQRVVDLAADPFYIREAKDRSSDRLRKVIVFRLIPLDGAST